MLSFGKLERPREVFGHNLFGHRVADFNIGSSLVLSTFDCRDLLKACHGWIDVNPLTGAQWEGDRAPSVTCIIIFRSRTLNTRGHSDTDECRGAGVGFDAYARF